MSDNSSEFPIAELGAMAEDFEKTASILNEGKLKADIQRRAGICRLAIKAHLEVIHATQG